MKSLNYLPVLLILFAIAKAPDAMAANSKSVTVTNHTSYTMSEFYASASDNSGWDTSNNLLAGQALAPGHATMITIADGLAACNYDLMAVLYGSAEHAYRYQVNACGSGTWTVH